MPSFPPGGLIPSPPILEQVMPVITASALLLDLNAPTVPARAFPAMPMPERIVGCNSPQQGAQNAPGCVGGALPWVSALTVFGLQIHHCSL
jgi:hypothetical protein